MVEAACGIGHHLMGGNLENVASDIDCYTTLQPLGVCAGICPFNFPAMVPLWMFPVSIAAGNTFVLKPSEKDPGAAMALTQLAHQAGLPPGEQLHDRISNACSHKCDDVTVTCMLSAARTCLFQATA